MNAILKLILNYKRITRNRLAALLKLSPSSIVKYIKLLIEMGMITETDRDLSTGGRRSTYLELNPDVGLNVVLVMSVSYMRGVLINTVGTVMAERSAPTYSGMPKDELLTKLYDVLDGLVQEAGRFSRKIFGIGAAMGGHMDPLAGVSHEYLFAKGWYDVPLKRLVEDRYGIPCFLVNDANACALGEKYYGKGIGVDHFLCVMIGEGIGMGIVTNGEIYMGKSHYAGEFGHTHSQDNGQLCFCGHTGCLETVSSQGYILSEVRKGLDQGVNSEVLKHCGGEVEALQIEHVIVAANNGDRFARNIFGQVGTSVGERLADIANIFNPEMIILRGSVIDGNRFLFESIERVVMNLTLRPIARSLKMFYSEDRDDIRLMGTSSVILIGYFSQWS
ncbi:MAG: ROK family transcriptional regulator [Spirochaetales bacterium]|nr:ROK family transcriptional regulator [Spirochaetales bacterium]